MRVAIIGGGASGTLAAIHLCQSRPSASVVLFEKTGSFAEGPAYRTRRLEHLLNVPAKALSYASEQPTDFANWLCRRLDGDSSVSFAPRASYREYLLEKLDACAGIERIAEEAIDLRRESGTWTLATSAATYGKFDAAILALGNTSPSVSKELSALEGWTGFLADPWSGGLESVRKGDDVFIVGTGLTMFDVVLSLGAERTGKIIARSRRGLIPHRHEATTPRESVIPPGRSALKEVRREAQLAGERWRDVIDGLRPQTVALWQTLSWSDRARFLRKLGPFWDIHRHRAAPEVWDQIASMRRSGMLDLAAGRLISSRPVGPDAEIEWEESGQRITHRFRSVINCTGPAPLSARPPTIIAELVSRGEIAYDPLGLGLAAKKLQVGEGLYAIGPMLKGERFESTAIREIREQAEALAKLV